MLIGMCGDDFPEVRAAIASAIPGVEFAIIQHDRSQLEPGKVDVLVPLGGTIDAALLDATQPALVQQFGVGVQGVDLDAARQRGIPVANISSGDSGNAIAVAEAAIMHLLLLLRHFPQLQHSVRSRVVGQPIGNTLAGRTVTVLGVGSIGTALITRLAAFGVTSLGVARRPYAELPEALRSLLAPERYFPQSRLTSALAASAALVVAIPLTDQTRGLIGAQVLAAMHPGGYLVNVGRGPVVDYDALLAALKSGHLAGAGLDVAWQEPIDPGDELLRHNVIVTPHIGGVTVESYAQMGAAFAANVARLEAGDDLASVVRI
jgi:phosphoglycerate dehydrogenase-like enzyme